MIIWYEIHGDFSSGGLTLFYGFRELSVQLTPTTAAILAFEHGKLVFVRPMIRTKLDGLGSSLDFDD